MNLKNTKESVSGKKPEEFLLFYGHNKYADQPGVGIECLSQWYGGSTFVSDDADGNKCVFSNAEQYMMYRKAELFKDKITAKTILKTSSPKECKELGRNVKNFDKNIWDKNKISIVFDGNILKFTQNSELKKFLLSTGDKVLVEAAPYDRIWGVGLGKIDMNVKDPEKWRGQNLLGFILMEVRENLRGK